MVRQQTVRLDVEKETFGRARGPPDRVVFRGRCVESGVDFHQRKGLRVKAKPLLRRADAGGVEGAGLKQRRVGPAASAVIDVPQRLSRRRVQVECELFCHRTFPDSCREGYAYNNVVYRRSPQEASPQKWATFFASYAGGGGRPGCVDERVGRVLDGRRPISL